MKVEKITPQKAADWLKYNTRNRKVKASIVEKYAGAMKRGEWRVTHEGIAFNCDGTIIDGQHRLMACIQANTPFEAYVFRGIDKNAFEVINSGSTRSAPDALGLLGEHNCNTLAATARAISAFQSPGGYAAGRHGMTLTTPQVIALVCQYKGIQSSVSLVYETDAKSVIAGSIVAALHWIVSRKHKEAADDFVKKIGSGEGITRTDPEWVLRKTLQKMRNSQQKPRAEVQAAYLVRAWNAKRAGTPLKLLRWSTNEAFPTIKS